MLLPASPRKRESRRREILRSAVMRCDGDQPPHTPRASQSSRCQAPANKDTRQGYRLPIDRCQRPTIVRRAGSPGCRLPPSRRGRGDSRESSSHTGSPSHSSPSVSMVQSGPPQPARSSDTVSILVEVESRRPAAEVSETTAHSAAFARRARCRLVGESPTRT